MPWCPKCKAEFRAGFTVCNSCDVPLIDHEPADGEPLPDLPEPEERWLRDDPKRARLLRVLRALIVLFIALAVVLLVADRGI